VDDFDHLFTGLRFMMGIVGTETCRSCSQRALKGGTTRCTPGSKRTAQPRRRWLSE
jgi:hypothetical protein